MIECLGGLSVGFGYCCPVLGLLREGRGGVWFGVQMYFIWVLLVRSVLPVAFLLSFPKFKLFTFTDWSLRLPAVLPIL